MSAPPHVIQEVLLLTCTFCTTHSTSRRFSRLLAPLLAQHMSPDRFSPFLCRLLLRLHDKWILEHAAVRHNDGRYPALESSTTRHYVAGPDLDKYHGASRDTRF
jgi:hypothetical protein